MPAPPTSGAAAPLTTACDTLSDILAQLTDPRTPDGAPAGSYGRLGAKRAALRQLPAVRAALEEATVALVTELRGTTPYGSWDEIGEALGISKQAARERFRRQGVQ